jgi:hypothetical protein
VSGERSAAEREAAAAERARKRAPAAAGAVPPPPPSAFGESTSAPVPAPVLRERPARTDGSSPRPAVPAALGGLTAALAGLTATTDGRRRLAGVAGAVLVVLALLFVVRGGGDDNKAAKAAAAADLKNAPPQLPGGGRTIFPGRRVVAFYGNPQDAGLGILGIGRQSTMLAKLRKQAAPYARKTRPVLPALELITTVAAASPGADGSYTLHTPPAVIDRYLRAARKAKALLILDIQPGLNDFPTEMRRLIRWLKEPDVSLALDPEWRVQPGQVPGKVIGSVTAAEVNRTTADLAQLTQANHLPQKLLVIHQFTEGMVSNPELVANRHGLATVFNVDGFGAKPNKVNKYKALVVGKERFHHGFKLFYQEDLGLMKPASVMALTPRPDLIVYE